ncbi:hypothetical protein F7725_004485 [Dissostichus mawsoni]|uniref:Dynactin subunit 6 n=1 Tax=Dissostichus mawsoni TaxID=36200 RepID=A0A7J5XJA0_DISMA|nr:hypothetical protein F7725_004485 [Dissostichus mawsoni]
MSDSKQIAAQKSAKIAAGAVVCVESEIRGDVTIGESPDRGAPKARIIAEAGPIIIGEGNLIEEQALIINRQEENTYNNIYPENQLPDSEGAEQKTMTIGTNNVFEVGCVSQALNIGDNNVIDGCIVGACCQLNTCEVVPENTVVYGCGTNRRLQSEKPQVSAAPAPPTQLTEGGVYIPEGGVLITEGGVSVLQPQTLQLDFLMKILPNYHHLKKTVRGNSTTL